MRCGVDLGGTNLMVALVDESHAVVGRTKAKTPTDGPEAVVEATADAVEELLDDLDVDGDEVTAIGVGAPGPIEAGIVRTATNLDNWVGPVPFADMLEKRMGRPVVVENDVTAGVVGEWIAGAGRLARNLLGVWMGTGVGGGLILEGRPYRGNGGGAGEFGHLTIHHGGALCGCGRRGCLEAYAGRANMEEVVAIALSKGEHTALEDIRRDKGKERITSGVWAKALDRGDPLATRLFDDAIAAVGAGIGSVVNLLDLSDVVIGGGFAEKLGQDLADRLTEAARGHLLIADHQLDVRVSTLGDDAGVVGAAALAGGL